jgi:CRP-like cAMP-binding protein
MRETVERLRTVPLFEGLGDEHLVELAFLATPFAVPAERRLFAQGEPSDGLYLIDEGAVAVTIRIPGDDVVHVARMGPGSMLGELGLLDRGPRSAHADTLEPTRGLFFSNRRFELLRNDLRPAAFAVLRRLLVEIERRTQQCHDELRRVASARPSPRPARWRHTDEPPVHRSADGWPSASVLPGDAIPPLAVASLPFFRELRDEELRRVLDRTALVRLPRGTAIDTRTGHRGDCFLVVRGAVLEELPLDEGAEPLAVHGPDALVGVAEAVNGGATTTHLTVREHALLLQVDAPLVAEWLRGGSVEALRFAEYAIDALVLAQRRANGHLSRLATARDTAVRTMSMQPPPPARRAP